jgi:hypothetical protein
MPVGSALLAEPTFLPCAVAGSLFSAFSGLGKGTYGKKESIPVSGTKHSASISVRGVAKAAGHYTARNFESPLSETTNLDAVPESTVLISRLSRVKRSCSMNATNCVSSRRTLVFCKMAHYC